MRYKSLPFSRLIFPMLCVLIELKFCADKTKSFSNFTVCSSVLHTPELLVQRSSICEGPVS